MTQALILATWSLWLLATTGIGYVATSSLAAPYATRGRLQLSLWTGLGLLVASALLLNLFWGMGTLVPSLFGCLWLTAGCASVLVFGLRARRRARTHVLRRILTWRNAPSLSVVAAFGGAMWLLAWFSAAEPMDYDAGLYRLGTINYSVEFATIPGLANLHDRFGFNSLLGPVTGLLSQGPWQGEGFRIVTGFFVAFIFVDATIRVLVPRSRTAGDYLTVLGTFFLMSIVLTDSGRWIPSPGIDLIALTLTIATFAYLADFIRPASRSGWQIGMVLILATLAGSARPLAWILLPSSAAVMWLGTRLAPVDWRVKPEAGAWKVPIALTSVTVLVVMMVRDAILSGWLLYPMSLIPLPVDWLAPDPVDTREGITWYARAPQDMLGAQSEGWLSGWIANFTSTREFTLLVALVIAAAVPVVWSRGRRAWREVWAQALLIAMPALLLSVAWFISAPDVRFNWGGLFALIAGPLAIALSANAYPTWFIRFAAVVAIAFLIVTNVRNGRFDQRGRPPEPIPVTLFGWELTLSLGPPNRIETIEGSLGDGTPVRYPTRGENCYQVFPLCLLPGSGTNVEKRGESISEGFRQQ